MLQRLDSKTIKREMLMDKKKKEKLVAIIISTLIALATSITACICETTTARDAGCAEQCIVQVI